MAIKLVFNRLMQKNFGGLGFVMLLQSFFHIFSSF